MTDRRTGRGRLFLGSILLTGAVAACITGLFNNPVDEVAATGADHVRETVVLFMRNSAVATLMLVALAYPLLFTRPRLRHPTRDMILVGVSVVLIVVSVYRLVSLPGGISG